MCNYFQLHSSYSYCCQQLTEMYGYLPTSKNMAAADASAVASATDIFHLLIHCFKGFMSFVWEHVVSNGALGRVYQTNNMAFQVDNL